MPRSDELQAQLELGHLASWRTGLIGGPAPPMRRPWVPAHVELDGDVLRWRQVHGSGNRPRVSREVSPDGALDAFMRIRRPRDVLRFACRWGPLILCSGGLPSSHPPGLSRPARWGPPILCGGGLPISDSANRCRPTRAEPLEIWFDLAKEARALAQAAVAIHLRKPAPRDDWEVLYRARRQEDGTFPEEIEGLFADLQRTEDLVLQYAWLCLKPVLDDWVAVSDVRPELPRIWDPDQSFGGLRLGGGGTFGVLAIQLLAAVGGAHDVCSCTACGELYIPRRKPARGRLHYCEKPDCKKVGAKRRQRRYSDRT